MTDQATPAHPDTVAALTNLHTAAMRARLYVEHAVSAAVAPLDPLDAGVAAAILDQLDSALIDAADAMSAERHS